MGVELDWDKLKEDLISAGMKPVDCITTYSCEDLKDVNFDLKDAREKRYNLLHNQSILEEMYRVVSKYKIMDNIDYEDCVILNNMTSHTLSKSDIKEHGYAHKWGDYKILENEIEFLSIMSVSIKYLEQARYDVIGRGIKTLTNSFGFGIEEHILNNVNKATKVYSGYPTIVSPEYTKEYGHYPVSYLLKEKQVLTNLNKYPPCYVVTQDCIDVKIDNLQIEFIGRVKLAFSKETFTLFEVY